MGQFPLSTKLRHTWLYFKGLLITAESVIFRQFRMKNVACGPNSTMQNEVIWSLPARILLILGFSQQLLLNPMIAIYLLSVYVLFRV